jgi:H/ACA ribonucleoprotein complex subunit 3
MSGHIRYCRKDHVYTLSAACPVCGNPSVIAHPARFSPEDRYGKYRRMAKND